MRPGGGGGGADDLWRTSEEKLKAGASAEQSFSAEWSLRKCSHHVLIV